MMLPEMSQDTATAVLDAFMAVYRMDMDGRVVDRAGRLAFDRSIALAEQAVRVLAGAE